MKWASPVASAALLLALLPAAVLAAGIPGVRGRTITPIIFRFTDLPRALPNEAAPIRERIEAPGPAEVEIEALKRNPRPPRLSEISQVTLDPSSAGGGLAPLAPTVGNGFEGIHQNGFIPGEPTVGAGPLNLLSCGNVSIVTVNKNGSSYVEVPGTNFFHIPSADGSISDAQCYYDAIHGHFVAIAFTTGNTGTPNRSNFYLNISQTNDAKGLWYGYVFDMTLDGTTPTTNWGDYEGIGVSEDKIAMSAQMFTQSSSPAYQYQKIRVIDRALAYAGQPLTYFDFYNFAPPAGGNVNDNFVTKPARNLTAGDSTIYCLCIRTNGGSRVTFRTLAGPPSAPTLSAGTLVPVSSYSPPPDAAQPGSATLVATNDCRPTDFYVRNGVLIVSFHTAANFGGGSVSALRLLRLRTSDQAVLTDELYGQAGVFYYFPAVTVDSLGTIFLGFDRSSSSEFSSAWATGKRRSDSSLEPSALLKSGVAATSQSRWGDFTGIDNDASAASPSGSTAWYAGQWVKAATAFGTWVNKLTFSYGVVSGTVSDDCDGSTGTTADRGPLAGVSLALKQGATTLATTVSDSLGNWSFGYLESGTYDVVVTPPTGGAAVDALPGTGGTSETRVSATDLQINLTNAQASSGNGFLVTSTHPMPVAGNLSPSATGAGGSAFTLTVNGSSFARCAVVRWDGSDRATTWVSANQLGADILAADIAAAGTHTVTVFTPTPGGGLSGGLTFTVNAQFSVTLTSSGKGSATKSPNQALYPPGTQVTMAATPDSGWAFTGWSGDTTTTANPFSIFVTSNRSYVAAFADTARPLVHVLAPNGGESVAEGSHLSLGWSALDNQVVARVDLLLSRAGAGGPFDTLAANVPNTGSYDWVVTAPATASAFLEVTAHDSAGNAASDLSDSAFAITGSAAVQAGAPVTALELAFAPNPTRGGGLVAFALPAATRVRLSVHDVQGREVALLGDGLYEPGRYRVAWRGAAAGEPGLYFIRLQAGGKTLIRRAVVIR